MKNKTAALIRQKQMRTNQKQKVPPSHLELNQNLSSQKNLIAEFNTTPLKSVQFSHYDAFSLAFHPPQSQYPQILVESGNRRNQEQIRELEKQNYRLIQSNYNLLARHAATIESIRHSLLQTIMMIEENHYVHAVKVLYSLLDRIRNISGTSSVETNNLPEQRSSPPGLKHRQSSAVEEYLIFDSSSPDARENDKRKNFFVVSNIAEFTHFPEPKSQFLSLNTNGRFIHIDEEKQDPHHPYPEMFTPHFRPRQKNNFHAYSLQQSFENHIQSSFQQPVSPPMILTQQAIRSNGQQRPENEEKEYYKSKLIFEKSEYGIREVNSEVRTESGRKSFSSKKKRHNQMDGCREMKIKGQQVEDLYRMLLLQASVIQNEASRKAFRV